jgi:hypothetical protein
VRAHIMRNASTAKPKIAPAALNGRGGAPKISSGIQTGPKDHKRQHQIYDHSDTDRPVAHGECREREHSSGIPGWNA